MSRYWRCRRQKNGVVCGQLNLAVKKKCYACGKPRPKPRQPAHKRVLSEMQYSDWVAVYGEVCGICGRAPSARRRLDRDHCHTSGQPRGLLCARCNRALPGWVTAGWLRLAAVYLERAEAGDYRSAA